MSEIAYQNKDVTAKVMAETLTKQARIPPPLQVEG